MPLHRPGGQAQYIDAPIEPPAAELLEWAREQLGDGIRVDDLATHASLSTRTLSRHFARHVGTTPGEWLARERLRLAQRLLEQTADPVAVVARRAGYASAATLRAQFAARLNVRRAPTGTRSAADDEVLRPPLHWRAGGVRRGAVERDPPRGGGAAAPAGGRACRRGRSLIRPHHDRPARSLSGLRPSQRALEPL